MAKRSGRKPVVAPLSAEDQRRYRLLQEEKYRRLKVKEWQLYPLVWLEERFGEKRTDYAWSEIEQYAKHKWDGSKDPLASAWMALADGYWTGIEAATGTSKTFFLSRVVCWYLDVFEDSLVVTSAPKQDQLNLHLWAEIQKIFHKFKRIRPYSELYSLRLVVDTRKVEFSDDNVPDFSKSWQAVGFVAGVSADEQSATKAQGFHRKYMLIICEETPGMPLPVMVAFQNTCTGDNNLMLSVGNPDSELDELHKFCMLEHVKNYRISALDYPNVVLKEEIIHGAVTQGSIDRRRVQYTENSQLYQSRVRGIAPTQSADSLIKLDWIIDACEKELAYDYSYHAVGVDVANSEDGDKAACCWGRGNQLERIEEFQCQNATHLAYNLIMDDAELMGKNYRVYSTGKVQEYEIMNEMIGVDAVGIGVATINALIDSDWTPVALQGGQWDEAIPLDNEEKPLYRFQSLRSQMYWSLREDLRSGHIKINVSDPLILSQLKRELVAIKFAFSGSYIAVEKKEDIKKRLGGKSPNVGDACVYWNWTRKGYHLTGGVSLPISAGG